MLAIRFAGMLVAITFFPAAPEKKA